MPIKTIRRDKPVFTNPISSKTIYPFVIDKKLSQGNLGTEEDPVYYEVGRLVRPVQPNTLFQTKIVFQCSIRNQTELLLNYIAELDGGTATEPESGKLIFEKGFNSFITKTIYFPNTFDNNRIILSVSAVNRITISSVASNVINLVYLEKEE